MWILSLCALSAITMAILPTTSGEHNITCTEDINGLLHLKLSNSFNETVYVQVTCSNGLFNYSLQAGEEAGLRAVFNEWTNSDKTYPSQTCVLIDFGYHSQGYHLKVTGAKGVLVKTLGGCRYSVGSDSPQLIHEAVCPADVSEPLSVFLENTGSVWLAVEVSCMDNPVRYFLEPGGNRTLPAIFHEWTNPTRIYPNNTCIFNEAYREQRLKVVARESDWDSVSSILTCEYSVGSSPPQYVSDTSCPENVSDVGTATLRNTGDAWQLWLVFCAKGSKELFVPPLSNFSFPVSWSEFTNPTRIYPNGTCLLFQTGKRHRFWFFVLESDYDYDAGMEACDVSVGADSPQLIYNVNCPSNAADDLFLDFTNNGSVWLSLRLFCWNNLLPHSLEPGSSLSVPAVYQEWTNANRTYPDDVCVFYDYDHEQSMSFSSSEMDGDYLSDRLSCNYSVGARVPQYAFTSDCKPNSTAFSSQVHNNGSVWIKVMVRCENRQFKFNLPPGGVEVIPSVYGEWTNPGKTDPYDVCVYQRYDRHSQFLEVLAVESDYDEVTNVHICEYSVGEDRPRINSDVTCPDDVTESFPVTLTNTGHVWLFVKVYCWDNGREFYLEPQANITLTAMFNFWTNPNKVIPSDSCVFATDDSNYFHIRYSQSLAVVSQEADLDTELKKISCNFSVGSDEPQLVYSMDCPTNASDVGNLILKNNGTVWIFVELICRNPYYPRGEYFNLAPGASTSVPAVYNDITNPDQRYPENGCLFLSVLSNGEPLQFAYIIGKEADYNTIFRRAKCYNYSVGADVPQLTYSVDCPVNVSDWFIVNVTNTGTVWLAVGLNCSNGKMIHRVSPGSSIITPAFLDEWTNPNRTYPDHTCVFWNFGLHEQNIEILASESDYDSISHEPRCSSRVGADVPQLIFFADCPVNAWDEFTVTVTNNGTVWLAGALVCSNGKISYHLSPGSSLVTPAFLDEWTNANRTYPNNSCVFREHDHHEQFVGIDAYESDNDYIYDELKCSLSVGADVPQLTYSVDCPVNVSDSFIVNVTNTGTVWLAVGLNCSNGEMRHRVSPGSSIITLAFLDEFANPNRTYPDHACVFRNFGLHEQNIEILASESDYDSISHEPRCSSRVGADVPQLIFSADCPVNAWDEFTVTVTNNGTVWLAGALVCSNGKIRYHLSPGSSVVTPAFLDEWTNPNRTYPNNSCVFREHGHHEQFIGIDGYELDNDYIYDQLKCSLSVGADVPQLIYSADCPVNALDEFTVTVTNNGTVWAAVDLVCSNRKIRYHLSPGSSVATPAFLDEWTNPNRTYPDNSCLFQEHMFHHNNQTVEIYGYEWDNDHILDNLICSVSVGSSKPQLIYEIDCPTSITDVFTVNLKNNGSVWLYVFMLCWLDWVEFYMPPGSSRSIPAVYHLWLIPGMSYPDDVCVFTWDYHEQTFGLISFEMDDDWMFEWPTCYFRIGADVPQLNYSVDCPENPADVFTVQFTNYGTTWLGVRLYCRNLRNWFFMTMEPGSSVSKSAVLNEWTNFNRTYPDDVCVFMIDKGRQFTKIESAEMDFDFLSEVFYCNYSVGADVPQLNYGSECLVDGPNGTFKGFKENTGDAWLYTHAWCDNGRKVIYMPPHSGELVVPAQFKEWTNPTMEYTSHNVCVFKPRGHHEQSLGIYAQESDLDSLTANFVCNYSVGADVPQLKYYANCPSNMWDEFTVNLTNSGTVWLLVGLTCLDGDHDIHLAPGSSVAVPAVFDEWINVNRTYPKNICVFWSSGVHEQVIHIYGQESDYDYIFDTIKCDFSVGADVPPVDHNTVCASDDDGFLSINLENNGDHWLYVNLWCYNKWFEFFMKPRSEKRLPALFLEAANPERVYPDDACVFRDVNKFFQEVSVYNEESDWDYSFGFLGCGGYSVGGDRPNVSAVARCSEDGSDFEVVLANLGSTWVRTELACWNGLIELNLAPFSSQSINATYFEWTNPDKAYPDGTCFFQAEYHSQSVSVYSWESDFDDIEQILTCHYRVGSDTPAENHQALCDMSTTGVFDIILDNPSEEWLYVTVDCQNTRLERYLAPDSEETIQAARGNQHGSQSSTCLFIETKDPAFVFVYSEEADGDFSKRTLECRPATYIRRMRYRTKDAQVSHARFS